MGFLHGFCEQYLENLLEMLYPLKKKYVAKDVINEILYIHPFGLAYMNRCCIWNRLVFVLSVYVLH